MMKRFRRVRISGCALRVARDADMEILFALWKATRDLKPKTYQIRQMPRTGDGLDYVIEIQRGHEPSCSTS